MSRKSQNPENEMFKAIRSYVESQTALLKEATERKSNLEEEFRKRLEEEEKELNESIDRSTIEIEYWKQLAYTKFPDLASEVFGETEVPADEIVVDEDAKESDTPAKVKEETASAPADLFDNSEEPEDLPAEEESGSEESEESEESEDDEEDWPDTVDDWE